MEQDFIRKASEELNRKDPDLQETYISHHEVKVLMEELIGQPIIDLLASNITYDDEPYVQNEAVERTHLEALEKVNSQEQESNEGTITPEMPAAVEVFITPPRLQTREQPSMDMPPIRKDMPPMRKVRPPWHFNSIREPEKSSFSLHSPVAQSTPLQPRSRSVLRSHVGVGNLTGPFLSPFSATLGSLPEKSPMSTGYRDPVSEDLLRTQEERDELEDKIGELEQDLEGSKAEILYLQEKVGREREGHLEEKEVLQGDMEDINKEILKLKIKLTRKEMELESIHLQTDKFAEDYEDLQEKHRNTQSVNARYLKEKKKAMEKLSQVEEVCNRYQGEVEQMGRDAYAKAHQLKIAKKDIEALQDELEKALKDSLAFTETIEQQEQLINELRLQNEDIMRENALFEGNYLGKGKRPRRDSNEIFQIKTLEEKLDKETKRLMKAIADKQGLRRQVDELENKNKNTREHADQMELLAKEKTKELQQQEESLQEVTNELILAKEAYKGQTSVTDMLSQKLAQTENELIAVNQSLNQAKRDIEQHQETIMQHQETIMQQQATIRNYEAHGGGMDDAQGVNLAQVMNNDIVRALRVLTPEELNRLNPQLWPATPYENVSVVEFLIWPILEILRHLVNTSTRLKGIYRNRLRKYNDLVSSPPPSPPLARPSSPLSSPQGPGSPTFTTQIQGMQTPQVLQKLMDILYYAERVFLAAVDPEKRCTSPNAFHRAIFWLLIFTLLLGTLVYQCILVTEIEAKKLLWAEANGPMIRSWLIGRKGECAYNGSPAGGVANIYCVDIRLEDPMLLQLLRHCTYQYFEIDRRVPV